MARILQSARQIACTYFEQFGLKTAHNLELPGDRASARFAASSSLPGPMNAKTAFDLIFRNARTRSSATPVDIGVSRRPDRRHRAAARLRGGRDRGRRQARCCPASSIPTSISTRPACSAAAATTMAASAEAIARGRGDEARFHGRGRLRARRKGDRTRHRARHHADAHPCRDRSAHRLARLRGDQGAEARLCLGDRSVDLRVSAGRPDQRSRRRGTADRGPARRRRSDRRLSLYGHRSERAYRKAVRPGAGNSMSMSTCISTSTSIRPGGISKRSAGRPSGATTRAASRSATPPNCRRCRRTG